MNPHAGKAKLLPVLIEITRTARDTIAATAFDKETVRQAIMAAGKVGRTCYTVSPQHPLNLRDTAAARALLLWLHEAGFQHSWEERQAHDKRPGDETVYELLVTWTV